jgi:Uma2 family endonuclease
MAANTTARAKKKTHPFYPGARRPAWEVAFLFPPQGDWTARDYLSLEELRGDAIRVELARGRLEVLPMPTEAHQFISGFMFLLLGNFTREHAPGKVSFSGLRLRLKKKGKRALFREPDILYVRAANFHLRHKKFWDGADLVMEVVSGDPKDRDRDYVQKPIDYTEAGIAEYWIIDADEKLIRVLTLDGQSYRVHGDFRPGTVATSALLPGFAVSVDDVLAAGEGK